VLPLRLPPCVVIKNLFGDPSSVSEGHLKIIIENKYLNRRFMLRN